MPARLGLHVKTRDLVQDLTGGPEQLRAERVKLDRPRRARGGRDVAPSVSRCRTIVSTRRAGRQRRRSPPPMAIERASSWFANPQSPCQAGPGTTTSFASGATSTAVPSEPARTTERRCRCCECLSPTPVLHAHVPTQRPSPGNRCFAIEYVDGVGETLGQRADAAQHHRRTEPEADGPKPAVRAGEVPRE